MLRITKMTDYGFILLAHMAHHDMGSLHNASDLSQTSGLTLPTVGKVLKILTKGNILTSRQGSKGGYSLARPPSQLSAAEIIAAVEGPVAITQCSGLKGCERDCPVRVSWQKVNHAVLDALEGVTLADMASEVKV